MIIVKVSSTIPSIEAERKKLENIIDTRFSGMIQEQTRSAHIREEMLAKEIDRKMIQRQTPLSLYREEMLLGDSDDKMILGQTHLNLNP